MKPIDRLTQAEAELDAANKRFGAICDKIHRRLEVLSRVPAAAALQRDMVAFAAGVAAVLDSLSEFVDAMKGVVAEGER